MKQYQLHLSTSGLDHLLEKRICWLIVGTYPITLLKSVPTAYTIKIEQRSMANYEKNLFPSLIVFNIESDMEAADLFRFMLLHVDSSGKALKIDLIIVGMYPLSASLTIHPQVVPFESYTLHGQFREITDWMKIKPLTIRTVKADATMALLVSYVGMIQRDSILTSFARAFMNRGMMPCVREITDMIYETVDKRQLRCARMLESVFLFAAIWAVYPHGNYRVQMILEILGNLSEFIHKDPSFLPLLCIMALKAVQFPIEEIIAIYVAWITDFNADREVMLHLRDHLVRYDVIKSYDLPKLPAEYPNEHLHWGFLGVHINDYVYDPVYESQLVFDEYEKRTRPICID